MPLHPDQPHLTASEAAQIREDYEELLRTPGWQRFLTEVQTRYAGGGYFNAMGHALKSGDQLKPLVYHETACEIMRIMNLPLTIVQDLKGSTE